MNIADSIIASLPSSLLITSEWLLRIRNTQTNQDERVVIEVSNVYCAVLPRVTKLIKFRLIYTSDIKGKISFKKIIIPNCEHGNHDTREKIADNILMALNIGYQGKTNGM